MHIPYSTNSKCILIVTNGSKWHILEQTGGERGRVEEERGLMIVSRSKGIEESHASEMILRNE